MAARRRVRERGADRLSEDRAAVGVIRLTAAYAKEREQFGCPIGTLQAVSRRLADGFIDTLGQSLTLWQAAWRLSEGLPGGTSRGHRDGMAHRYFTAAKRFEFLFGGATGHALAVGRALASAPACELRRPARGDAVGCGEASR